jgi:uncharacterized protein (DUF2235 family)
MSAEFKRTFCTNVNVYFLGLWDCVASVGFIPRKLPFSKSPTNSINYFRHAMALDEHRSKFKICQWQNQNPDLKRANTIDQTPAAQMKRGVQRSGVLSCFGLFGKKKPNVAQTNGHTSNGVNGVNGTAEKDHYDDAGASQDLQGATKKDIEQNALEKYFEQLDATRKRHHGVKTDVLELWFM